ncbi:MAG: hypothetical protein ABI594_05455 [Ginsengibacter sp.]
MCRRAEEARLNFLLFCTYNEGYLPCVYHGNSHGKHEESIEQTASKHEEGNQTILRAILLALLIAAM